MKNLWVAVASVALCVGTGCGGEDKFPDTITVTTPPTEPTPKPPDTITNHNNNTNVNVPANPVGTVSGQVVASDLSPLADAAISLVVGNAAAPLTTTTDASGSFRFAGIPAGAQVLVTITKPGYATMRGTSTVPSSAGNVPINDGNASFGPVMLTQLNGAVRYLVTTPQGRPATGARATLRVSPAGQLVLSNNDSSTFQQNQVVVNAVVDAQGLLVFGGVPTPLELSRFSNGQYQLFIDALDANADGIPETAGHVSTDSATSVLASGGFRSIVLGFPGTSAFFAESSNLTSLRAVTDLDPLRNTLRANETIQLVFTHPVAPASLQVRLTNEYGDALLPVTAQLGVGGYVATVTPGAGGYTVGAEYNLEVRAVSSQTGAMWSVSGFYYVGEANPADVSIARVSYQETATTGPTSTQLNGNEVVFVHFTVPIATTFGGQLQAFINSDIGGPTPGVVGDAYGEVGYHTGFTVYAMEPTAPVATRIPFETAVFPLVMSGYTTRWAFSFATTTLTDLSNVGWQVAFAGVVGAQYETFWGQRITQSLTFTGPVTRQPAPTP